MSTKPSASSSSASNARSRRVTDKSVAPAKAGAAMSVAPRCQRPPPSRGRRLLLPRCLVRRPDDSHIGPRIGNADARLPEAVPDPQKHLALDIAEPRLGVRTPVAQLMLDRALAKGGDPHTQIGRAPWRERVCQ